MLLSAWIHTADWALPFGVSAGAEPPISPVHNNIPKYGWWYSSPFSLNFLSSVYSGHHSILIPPSEVEVNPALWLTAVSQFKVRDTFCSYGVMELCTKGLGTSVNLLKQRNVNLACVRTCVVVAEERPRIALTNSFSKLFSALGLSPRAVSTSFGCRVNVAICLQVRNPRSTLHHAAYSTWRSIIMLRSIVTTHSILWCWRRSRMRSAGVRFSTPALHFQFRSDDQIYRPSLIIHDWVVHLLLICIFF